MTIRWLGTMLSLAVAALPAAQAQTIDDQTLVQVRPGPKRYFYQEYEGGCPAMTAKCRMAAYVVPGDLLVASGRNGAFTSVEFVNAKGTTTHGFIETVALLELHPPSAAGAAAWLGMWHQGEADVEIKRTRRPGALAVHGDATWGSFDPQRVASGGINLGELDGAITVAGSRIVRPRAISFSEGFPRRSASATPGCACSDPICSSRTMAIAAA